MRTTHDTTILLAAAGLLAAAPVAAQEPSPSVELDTIEVIGVTPVHGLGVVADRIPATVQAATGDEIERSQTLNLNDFLNRQFTSVHINDAQNNPFQPDLQFRGFTASPLLGLPQGIAVYQDGVRVNEPFGDTVNWDLLPQSAIATINLMSGSNPLFGLNSLGGSISIQTKSGFTHPGHAATAEAGSWGRHRIEFESGARDERVAYFVTGTLFEEEGWRDFSDSRVKQLFGNIGWRRGDTLLSLTTTLADNELRGNGALPIQLLERDREAIFTHPDITENELRFVSLGIEHFAPSGAVISGNLYYRGNDVATFNGDDSDYEECDSTGPNAGFLCIEDDGVEERVEDQNGNDIAVGPGDEFDATQNRSTTDQESVGGTLQLGVENRLARRHNQLVVGAAIDRGRARFRAQTEIAELTATRGTEGNGLFDAESFVRVNTEKTTYSLFFSDTLALTDRLAFTLAGRYNHTDITLRDRLGTALSGDHSFSRFNPAAGFTFRASDVLTLFGGYSESSRAPTPVELTCADEDDPCRLPNAFLADPPLDQVVARTFEAGLRGRAARMAWNLTAFQTTNDDDILFISSGALTNEGFFDNVGTTRRRGLELGISGRHGRADWSLGYTYLDATFEEEFLVASENHPLAVNDQIPVEPGDRIPGIPRHLFKAGIDYGVTAAFSLGADLVYNSGQHLRGDEGNLLDTTDAYTLIHLRGEYRIGEHLSLFGQVNNLFDTEYETFGLLGAADEVLGPAFDDPRFLGVGAPRAVWVGVKWSR